MSEILGPYRYVETAKGDQAPWYVMPFDRHGNLQAPRSRELLLDALRAGDFTDVVLFSHGWNNDWDAAMGRYEDFIGGFTKLRIDHNLEVRDGYRPLLVGIIWPGTALVMPWEKPPRFGFLPPFLAPGADPSPDSRVAPDTDPRVRLRPEQAGEDDRMEERRMIEDIAAGLPRHDLARFYELLDEPGGLEHNMAIELAEILIKLGEGHEEIPAAPATAADMVEAWKQALLQFPTKSSDGVDVDVDGEEDRTGEDRTTGGGLGDTQVMGILKKLDPRELIRLCTVWQMKDRAGVVGSQGVAPLLAGILDAESSIRVHVVGHSYGSKVVMSAISAAPLSRQVASALLLQPAVSCFCFAEDAHKGEPGGFRVALERISLPVMTTFSRHDASLRKFFHLAVRRKSDIGETGLLGGAQSRHAALGGYGPEGLVADELGQAAMRPVGETYDLSNRATRGERVLAIEAHDAISGHGDVSNKHTWWALYDLMASS